MKPLPGRRIDGTNHDSTQPIHLNPPEPGPDANPRPSAALAPLWWLLTTLAMTALVWLGLNLIHP